MEHTYLLAMHIHHFINIITIRHTGAFIVIFKVLGIEVCILFIPRPLKPLKMKIQAPVILHTYLLSMHIHNFMNIHYRTPTMVIEGQEKQAFWDAIGGKQDYASDKRLQVVIPGSVVSTQFIKFLY